MSGGGGNGGMSKEAALLTLEPSGPSMPILSKIASDLQTLMKGLVPGGGGAGGVRGFNGNQYNAPNAVKAMMSMKKPVAPTMQPLKGDGGGYHAGCSYTYHSRILACLPLKQTPIHKFQLFGVKIAP